MHLTERHPMSEDDSVDDSARADEGVELRKDPAPPQPAEVPTPPPGRAEVNQGGEAGGQGGEAPRGRGAARRAAAAGSAPSRRGLVIATAVSGAVAIALGTLLIITFLAWQHQKDVNSSRGQVSTDVTAARVAAVAAAKSFAVDFGSYDYQHLDTEFQEVADRMTPDFAKSYLETSDKLKPTFEQYKTQVTARIQGIGVTSASATNAVVVVFLDQTVHTSQSTAPRIDRNRLEIHLVQTGGEWLVSKLLAK